MVTRFDGLIENDDGVTPTADASKFKLGSTCRVGAYHETITDVDATNRHKFYLRSKSRLKEIQDPLIRIRSSKNEHCRI